MKTLAICLLTLFTALMSAPAWSAMQIEIPDPLYFKRQHDVIFPWADAKLVTFEFESVDGIQGGKHKAKELHDQFLRKIQGLPGGAILTFLTPDGQRIENYRFTARQVAKQQKAQMSLWGRMFPDESGASLINVRLELVEPPNGIQTILGRLIKMPRGQRQSIGGFISDEVSQTRIDFLTVKESNVGALADFLSGLAFYYKGAKNDSASSERLLRTAIEQLGQYIGKTSDQVDYSAASAAHVYIARAYYRLSRLEGSKRHSHLLNAEHHGAQAIELNPYESDPYTVLAVILSDRMVNTAEIEALLAKAVALAPGSLTSSYNLALVNSVNGQLQDAIQRLEQIKYLQQQDQQSTYKDLDRLQDKLRTIKQEQQRLAKVEPSNPDWQRGLSISQQKIDNELKLQGEDLESYQASIAIIERLIKADPSNPDWPHVLSGSQEKIGDVLESQGDLSGALLSYRDSMAIRERLTKADPSNADWQVNLSGSQEKIGDVLESQGDLSGALESYRDSMAIRERLTKADPSNADWQSNLLGSHGRIGDVLESQGELSGALESYRDSMAIAERLAKADPSNADWQSGLSLIYGRVGDIEEARGNIVVAIAAYEKSLPINETLADRFPGHSQFQKYLAFTNRRLTQLKDKLD